MLLVKTFIGQSKLHGIGVFAGEFIPKGTLIWKYVEGFDFTIPKKNVKKFPKPVQEWIRHFGYVNVDEEEYVICVDDARFFNHSDNPNTDDTTYKGTIAKRDIKKGEELTCDYFEFDRDAGFKLNKSKQ